MNDNEKLIEEARRWPAGVGPIPSAAPGNLITRLTDALEAAEKTRTPTGDEREAQGWREANLYAVDAVSQDDFMTGWRTADRLRRSEVLGGEAWQVAIEAERERQIAKGYTAEHDARHGIRHLLCWAIDYDRRGKTLEASALKRAALDLLPREQRGEPFELSDDEEARADAFDAYMESNARMIRELGQGDPSDAARTVPEPARMHIAAEGRGVLCGAVSPTHITNGTRYADCAACLAAAGGAR